MSEPKTAAANTEAPDAERFFAVDRQGPRARGAQRAQQRDPRPGARRHRRGHRRRRADRDRRLPDRRGRRGESCRPAGPDPAGARGRVRPRDGIGLGARRRAADRVAAAARGIGKAGRPRAHDDRQPRRPRRRDARVRRVDAPVHRQLGIPARAGDLHVAANAELERCRARQQGSAARRHRLVDRARGGRSAKRRCRATCSCRSTR